MGIIHTDLLLQLMQPLYYPFIISLNCLFNMSYKCSGFKGKLWKSAHTRMLVKSQRNGISHDTGRFARDILLLSFFAQS